MTIQMAKIKWINYTHLETTNWALKIPGGNANDTIILENNWQIFIKWNILTILSNNSIDVYLREMKTEVHTANVNCSLIPRSQKPISSRIDKNIVVLQYTIEYFSARASHELLIPATIYVNFHSIALKWTSKIGWTHAVHPVSVTLTQHSRKGKAVETKQIGLVAIGLWVMGGIAYRVMRELPRVMQMFHMLVWVWTHNCMCVRF